MNLSDSILVIRLGAMGDIIHALPAVASLRRSFPKRRIIWVVARKWVELLEGNPHLDEILPFERRGKGALYRSWKALRPLQPGVAIDFQGLIQSALVGRAARPKKFIGPHRSQARESLAAIFYSDSIKTTGPHRVETNLQLAVAAGATQLTTQAWLPEGRPEGALPRDPFVLASPFAGWTSKQWPLHHYSQLAEALRLEGLPLVVNVPPGFSRKFVDLRDLQVHESGLPGLIDATRRAAAVVGVDSGPMHLAAALGKPGVAIFGPTDPQSNGPFRSRLIVLRDPNAVTSFKREDEIDPTMIAIGVDQVKEALLYSMRSANITA
jgi:heptosyltransferase-1